MRSESRRHDSRPGFRPHCLLAIALLLPIALTAAAQPRFEGEGQIVALDHARGSVTLDHGPIPGLMAAMRMEFPVRHSERLRALLVGTLVRFSLEPRGSEWVVVSIDPIRAPAVRAVTAPDFTLPALSGGSVRLAGLRGKAVIVNFWATWCIPCRAEMPTLEDLYRRYKGDGLEVLAVNLDRLSVAGVEAFVKEAKLSFPILLDPDWSTTRLYGVIGLPTTYLIDRTGQVVVREVGERDWTDEVARAAVNRLLH